MSQINASIMYVLIHIEIDTNKVWGSLKLP